MWATYNSLLNDFSWLFIVMAVALASMSFIKQKGNSRARIMAIAGLVLALPGFYVIYKAVNLIISGKNLIPM